MNVFKNVFFTKTLLLLSATILFTNLSYSQKRVFEGYYLNKSGDTINGVFPAYSEWSKNPSVVKFTPAGSQANVELTPENAGMFTVLGYDTYIAFKGQRLTNPIETEQAIAKKDEFVFENQYAPINSFVRLIATIGNKQFYEYNDNIRRNFFYSENGAPLQELVFKMYYDQGKVLDVFEYRQQLSKLFGNEINEKGALSTLETLSYNEEGFSALFSKLSPEIKKAKVKNPASGWIIAAGVAYNTLKVTGDKIADAVGLDYKGSVAPIFSIGYNAPIGRNFNRYFLYPKLKLSTYNFKAEENNTVTKKVIGFKASAVISPTLDFGVNIINLDKHKWFISGGTGLLYFINNKQTRQTLRASDNTQYGETNEIKLITMSYNFHLSTGISLNNKMVAEVTYNLPATISNFVFYSPKYSSLQLTVGYKF